MLQDLQLKERWLGYAWICYENEQLIAVLGVGFQTAFSGGFRRLRSALNLQNQESAIILIR